MSYMESDSAKHRLLNSATFDMRDVELLNTPDLTETLFRSAVSGRVPLLMTLLRHRGSRPVTFDDLPDSLISTLNGKNIELGRRYSLRYITNLSELKSLFSSIHDSGMKGLLEPGHTYPLLLRDIDTTVKRSLLQGGEFGGALPELGADTLSQPELAIVLNEESLKRVTPDAYRPILCWASQDMVSQFPECLRVLSPFQEVNNKISMQEWKDSYDSDEPVTAGTITLGLKADDHHTGFAEFLCAVMAPSTARLGLPDTSGRVMCETTTDFLLGFPAVNQSQDNFSAARAFVKTYCPFEIIATQAAKVCARVYGHKLREYTFEKYLARSFHFGRNELLEQLSSDNPIRDQVLNMMRKEQWLGLVKSFNSASASVKTLLALRETFGIDNTSLPVYLSRDAMTELISAGYRFADGTSVHECADDFSAARWKCSNRSSDVLLEFDGADWQPEYADHMPARMVQDIFIKQYQQIMSTNLWPAPIPKPADVKEALDLIVAHDNGNPTPRENTALALRAYLVTAGLEACMQAAQTAHWERLMDVFGKEAFEPYIKTLPHKARGLLLEDEMGL